MFQFQGLAAIMSERITDAAPNPSRALVHSRGLQEALQHVPPASPMPGKHLVLRIAGVWHHAHLILRRKKAGGVHDKSWEAQAMTVPQEEAREFEENLA